MFVSGRRFVVRTSVDRPLFRLAAVRMNEIVNALEDDTIAGDYIWLHAYVDCASASAVRHADTSGLL